MTSQEAIEVLRTEVMCVRNKTCERKECKECLLAMPEQDVLDAINMAIDALKEMIKSENAVSKKCK